MNWRLAIPMTLAVLVIWLVGAAVTKYSLEQMAYLAPIAVVVVGGDDRPRAALGEDRAAESLARPPQPSATPRA